MHLYTMSLFIFFSLFRCILRPNSRPCSLKAMFCLNLRTAVLSYVKFTRKVVFEYLLLPDLQRSVNFLLIISRKTCINGPIAVQQNLNSVFSVYLNILMTKLRIRRYLFCICFFENKGNRTHSHYHKAENASIIKI